MAWTKKEVKRDRERENSGALCARYSPHYLSFTLTVRRQSQCAGRAGVDQRPKSRAGVDQASSSPGSVHTVTFIVQLLSAKIIPSLGILRFQEIQNCLLSNKYLENRDLDSMRALGAQHDVDPRERSSV